MAWLASRVHNPSTLSVFSIYRVLQTSKLTWEVGKEQRALSDAEKTTFAFDKADSVTQSAQTGHC
jgi:hypothetical protein